MQSKPGDLEPPLVWIVPDSPRLRPPKSRDGSCGVCRTFFDLELELDLGSSGMSKIFYFRMPNIIKHRPKSSYWLKVDSRIDTSNMKDSITAVIIESWVVFACPIFAVDLRI